MNQCVIFNMFYCFKCCDIVGIEILFMCDGFKVKNIFLLQKLQYIVVMFRVDLKRNKDLLNDSLIMIDKYEKVNWKMK